MLGHAQHDAQKYVPRRGARGRGGRATRSPGSKRCCATRAGRREEDLAAIRDAVDRELDAAVDDVLAEPDPPGEDARTRVYASAELDAAVPWTRGPVPGYEGVS